MSDKAASWAHSEDYRTPDDVLLHASERAAELGCGAVSPGTGALLSVLAAATRATAVAEVGTGAGVSGLWLLRGMAPDGVLTTIDSEAEHQRAAKQAFADEQVRPTRTRTITGRALEVLPRLADGAYDMVVVDGDPLEAADYVEQAVRLLRPGGLLVVPHAMAEDRVPDPARRDELTTAMRELGKHVRSDERLVAAMVPTGDGVLVAARR
ncbi:O-methyltransferase [Actinotalea sp. M2MS4P-6]|uniref:O-methyltransferase n=1 Tax=Actinotalea sp. M2MS4P-6 TaxID=2983762 RepID=UPI0021E5057D|nr:O-methyltransferase [Actinotalea sp. M2MS4P-6]MCV2393476.1 O-methyltransferase [Actinotalea sp. M2MS4P-6]